MKNTLKLKYFLLSGIKAFKPLAKFVMKNKSTSNNIFSPRTSNISTTRFNSIISCFSFAKYNTIPINLWFIKNFLTLIKSSSLDINFSKFFFIIVNVVLSIWDKSLFDSCKLLYSSFNPLLLIILLLFNKTFSSLFFFSSLVSYCFTISLSSWLVKDKLSIINPWFPVCCTYLSNKIFLSNFCSSTTAVLKNNPFELINSSQHLLFISSISLSSKIPGINITSLILPINPWQLVSYLPIKKFPSFIIGVPGKDIWESNIPSIYKDISVRLSFISKFNERHIEYILPGSNFLFDIIFSTFWFDE